MSDAAAETRTVIVEREIPYPPERSGERSRSRI